MLQTHIITNEIYKNPNLDLNTKVPSIIENNDLSQSLSESSIQSYNIYTNLIPGKKNEKNDIKSIKQNDNIKVLKSHLLVKKDKLKNNNFNFVHNHNSNSWK